MADEGYIKFNCTWDKSGSVSEDLISDINKWRKKLYDLGLIGAYENGIGFGNISKRLSGNKFLISGSKTGTFPQLSKEQYTIVTSFDIGKNELACSGPVIASSESLTHAALYMIDESIRAVIHIHNLALWGKLLNNVPTTKDVPYGTPEMALEMNRLFKETDVAEKKMVVMAGHKEGIITFGKTLEEAGNVILSFV